MRTGIIIWNGPEIEIKKDTRTRDGNKTIVQNKRWRNIFHIHTDETASGKLVKNIVVFKALKRIQIMFNNWSEFPSDDESVVVRSGVEAILPLRGALTYASEEVLQLATQKSLP
ncbi:hypothetical protein EVAR_91512_1 [Eumeta japonica]|uniref:Uncharacterized protein n=1 Tax=Eumeta variegata TaxID=151549 RepID=A0A4C1VAU5_EUMVA|nr:hypothetical protein EVAR_91512_1 [Eumeta japonica]